MRAGGADVYAAFFEAGNGYRNDATRGVATGNDAEVIYMVTSGVHYNGGCCFDYGNAEVNNHDDGAGTMEAVYFGSCAFIAHHVAPPAAPKTATLTNPKTRPNRAPRPYTHRECGSYWWLVWGRGRQWHAAGRAVGDG